MSKNFAKVALLNKNLAPLYYSIPDRLKDHLTYGSLVSIPLKKMLTFGFVIDITEKIPEELVEIKIESIKDLLSSTPFFDKRYIDFFNFSSFYYSISLAEILKSVFPERIILKKKEIIKIKDVNPLDPVTDFLSRKKSCTIDRLIREFPNLEYKHIKELENAGFIETDSSFLFKKIILDHNFYNFEPLKNDLSFTDEQKKYIDIIENSASKSATYLLTGKTGSGKTELLLKLSEIFFKKGFSVLYMVPEISIASYIFRRITSYVNKKNVLIWHSSLPMGLKRYFFDRLRCSNNIIIGTRSSIFLPFYNPGLIIVDEEHDGSYKNEGSFPYNARDLAIARSKYFLHPVILSSATPSIETIYKAKIGDIKWLTLSTRFHPSKPEICIVNIEKSTLLDGFFSHTLLQKIEDNLMKKEQTLIFINRRGYVPYIYCNECKKFIECKFCTVPLTWHRSKNSFICHKCGYTTPFKFECPLCKKNNVFLYGAGTEKIAELLKERYSSAKIIKIDRDTAEKQDFFKKELKDIIDGKYDIIVATQILAKGHHLPKLSLVGVLLGDQGLNLPDFRAQERTFQLLTQVLGRAGRELPGRIVIQTTLPDSPSINFAINEDLEGFYTQEIKLRKETQFPPFSRLLVIKLFSRNEDILNEKALEIYSYSKSFEKTLKVFVFEPIPAPIYKERNYYKMYIYCKAEKAKSLIALIRKIKESIKLKDIRIIFDMDPYNLI